MKFFKKEEEKKPAKPAAAPQAPAAAPQARPPQAEQQRPAAVQAGQGGSQVDKLRRLIQLLSGTKDNRLDPVVNVEEGRVSYPLLTHIGLDERDIPLLEKLSESSVNILERGVYERLPVCPEHPQSLSASLRLYCPACSSQDIKKLLLIEHKVCGHITEAKNFASETDPVVEVCPACKKKIVDEKKELRPHGMWYECLSCMEKFDNPVYKLFCRKFAHDFNINEAEMIVIPYYKLKEETKRVYVDVFTVVPMLRKTLTTYGFAVEDSPSVKGKSGVAHTVSLYAYNKANQTILVDIKGAEAEIDDAEVTATFVKVLDIAPTIAIFVGIPSVSKRARAMTAAHIAVVTGKNANEIIAQIDAVLARHFTKVAPSTGNKPE